MQDIKTYFSNVSLEPCCFEFLFGRLDVHSTVASLTSICFFRNSISILGIPKEYFCNPEISILNKSKNHDLEFLV